MVDLTQHQRLVRLLYSLVFAVAVLGTLSLVNAVNAQETDGCPATAPLPLDSGSRGRVIPGQGANRVRDLPSTSGAVLYQIDSGSVFDVIGPAACGDGYRWWHISALGRAGWTAEGDETGYFLEPISVLPPLAQSSAGPIVIAGPYNRVRDANLYQLDDGHLTLLDDTLHVVDAAMSPDGRFLAANVMASVVLESEGCSGPLPVDLWLLNIETGDSRMLREQPEHATYCDADNNISRSAVEWSLDGGQFVWTEYHSGEDTLSLGVYDLATGQASVVPLDFPEQSGAGPMPLTPYWLASGIAFHSVTYTEAAPGIAVAVRLYQPDGTFIAETPVWIADDYGLPDTVLLVTYAGRDYAAHHWYINDLWILYDLLNQEAFWFGEMPVSPEMVSAAQPDASLRVRFRPMEAYTPYAEHPYQADVVDASGTVLHDPLDIARYAEAITRDVVLSPDGQALAFRHYDADTRSSDITVIGAAAASTFTLGEDIGTFTLVWGRWQWIFPDTLILDELPESWG